MKSIIAYRVQRFSSSEIMDFFSKGKNLAHPIDLSIGIPYGAMTSQATEGAEAALANDNTRYIRAGGLGDLREALATKLRNHNKLPATAETTIVTPGVSGGLFLAMGAILNPGDEIIIPDPFFLAYRELAVLLDAKPVYADTYPSFELDVQKVAALISPKTKAIVINSPNNPTGTIYSETTLRALADLCRQHDIVVISDEIYEDFAFDGRHFSIGSCYDLTITLNGFSKNHAMTGMRVGYAHSTPEIIAAMTELEQFVFFSNSSVGEYAALAALPVSTTERMQFYAQNREYITTHLSPQYKRSTGAGAFFFFLKHPTLNGREFAAEALKRELVVIPGDIFSNQPEYFRISYAVDPDILARGIDELNKMI